ncbi:hypothetical protein PPEP_a4242 [Pseudoalteromonas peptidolytica F12-50-A1]|uniref:Uncharacterized protein n=2 Tax=Pseudoalteromonas TaxID=53246 RepID=A0A8I0MXX6_9GAMM|nr:hypothetical protein [Pseudoalteromonas peptidolytica F12-50-A1]RXF04074.1 hypothetical protein D9603_06775 [Pseudoalteromonas sp. PS5]GEK07991.1 hypothetical protein PPE03_02400 [Pseudoalteromonas peptidolytica]
MYLEELIDYVMIETGGFIMGDLEMTQIDKHQFHLIVKRALGIYNKYCPQSKRLIVDCDKTYDFTTSPLGRPNWVSNVTPLDHESAIAELVYGRSIINKPPVWEYQEPTLFIAGSAGKYDVTALYFHDITDIMFDENNRVTTCNLPSISYDDVLFLDLLVSYSLLAIGRSRRAFTLQDFPVSMDGKLLVYEGRLMLKNTKRRLQEQSRWHHAIG